MATLMQDVFAGHRRWSLFTLLAVCTLAAGIAGERLAAKDADAVVDEIETPKPKRNPFVPRDNLDATELFEYIDRMMEAPRSVKNQEEFGPGMYACAERLLTKNPGESMRAYAETVKLDMLQQVAQFENQEYQDKLVALAKTLANDSDKGVAARAKYYLLENDLVSFESRKPEELGKLLDEAYDGMKGMTGEDLNARHLRIASYLTRAINAETDEKRVASDYKRFGELFAKSELRELRTYGKRIAKGIPKKGGGATELVGKPMPLAGVTHDDKPFNVEQYRGKVVLVDFWATWCGPCKAAMPALKELYDEKHEEGFEVVGISLDQDKDALKEYIEANEIEWPNVFDADDSIPDRTALAETYGVRAIPTTYLLDKEGKVVAMNLHGKDLTKKVEDLLSGKTTAAKEAAEKATEKPAEEKKE